MLVARALQGLDLTGDEEVLDLGWGEGVLTAALAARLPRGRVLGIDRSPVMVATASRRAETTVNLRCEVNSPTDMTYDSDFDLVVSFNMLHWISEQLEVCARSRRPCAWMAGPYSPSSATVSVPAWRMLR